MLLERLRWKRKLNRWHRKKISKLHDADVVLLRYPKSGVTWLRVMISEIYRRRLSLQTPHLIGSKEFTRLFKTVPKFLIANVNMGLPQDEVRGMMATHKVIFLVRDPRDIVVSLYFHFTRRATKLEYMSYGIPENVAEQDLFTFACNEHYGLPNIIHFMNYWHEALKDSPQAVVLRYEDLRADPVGNLGRLMALISPGTTADEITMAVDFAAFENMAAKEATGTFGVDILTPANTEDSDSFKVRRGKIGGYVDYLSDEQSRTLDAMVRDRLSPAFGYQ